MEYDLNNFTSEPDPEVWDRIEQTLHRRAIRRRTLTAASVLLATAAILAVIFVPASLQNNNSTNSATLTTAPTAQSTPLLAKNNITPTVAPAVHNNAPVTSVQPATVAAKHTMPASSTVQPTTSRGAMSPISEPVSTVKQENTPAAVTAVVSSATPVTALQQISSDQLVESIVTPDETTLEQSSATTSQPALPDSKATTSPNEDTILWIPNAFAPASDNEAVRYFRVRLNHPGAVTDYRIHIYTRSGQLVYQSNLIDQPWDGTYKGRELPQSAYVYIIQYTDNNHFKHQRKGTITLIR